MVHMGVGSERGVWSGPKPVIVAVAARSGARWQRRGRPRRCRCRFRHDENSDSRADRAGQKAHQARRSAARTRSCADRRKQGAVVEHEPVSASRSGEADLCASATHRLAARCVREHGTDKTSSTRPARCKTAGTRHWLGAGSALARRWLGAGSTLLALLDRWQANMTIGSRSPARLYGDGAQGERRRLTSTSTMRQVSAGTIECRTHGWTT